MMSMLKQPVLAVVALLLVGGAIGVFVIDAGATTPEPAHFDDTVTVGMTMEDRHAMPPEATIPKAQAYYARYRYAVGFYGVELAADSDAREQRATQLGPPLVTYVSDFAATGADLSPEGYPVTDSPTGWTDAESAVYVIDSEARTQSRSVVVPFSDPADAEAFADDHGGEVVDWETLTDREFADAAEGVRESVADRESRADDLVEDVSPLDQRPVSTTVDQDAETIQGAIDRAPPNTTVELPAGEYQLDDEIELDRPITLAGTNATLRGNENGSVVRVTADDAAVIGLTIDGVGNQTRDPDAGDDDADDWDQNVELGYGHGDAGIAVIGAEGVLVRDVEITTPANGVLLRDAPGAVVSETTVYGSEEWMDGFMGVMAMRSPGVVERSAFHGGRDGVYSHRSHGLVVRDSTMTDGRYGVHLMYTSETLVANNTMRDQQHQGVVIMTDPERNAIVDNDIRGVSVGISTLGRDSYIARNVVADNARGIQMAAQSTIYEHNVVVGNAVGARTSLVVPTAQVSNNDFLDNDVPVEATTGPLRIWTADGVGNYWGGTTDVTGTPGSRAYSPTDPIDGRLHRVDGARTLAHSPGVHALRGLRGTTPGLRSGSVVDSAPRSDPVNPELIEQARADEPTENVTNAVDHSRTD